MDDIFDKIIRGEIPSTKVYEDDVCIIILDINKITTGHLLVIPKVHYTVLTEMDCDTCGYLFALASKTAEAQMQVLGNTSYNILCNNGYDSGQEVPHFHIHVIPRHSRSELEIKTTLSPLDENDYKIAKLIAKEIEKLT
jgi:histidine triad (HIT) family protein